MQFFNHVNPIIHTQTQQQGQRDNVGIIDRRVRQHRACHRKQTR